MLLDVGNHSNAAVILQKGQSFTSLQSASAFSFFRSSFRCYLAVHGGWCLALTVVWQDPLSWDIVVGFPHLGFHLCFHPQHQVDPAAPPL